MYLWLSGSAVVTFFCIYYRCACAGVQRAKEIRALQLLQNCGWSYMRNIEMGVSLKIRQFQYYTLQFAYIKGIVSRYKA